MKVLLVNGSPHQKDAYLLLLLKYRKLLPSRVLKAKSFISVQVLYRDALPVMPVRRKTPRGAFLKISFTLILSTGSKTATGS